MARVIDASSEAGFVFASLMEFMKAWESGANARLFLESTNGSAFVSFGCFLGQPTERHFKPKQREKSKKKQERDNQRAANFQAAMKQNGVGDPATVDNEDENAGGGNPSHEDVVPEDDVTIVEPSHEENVAAVDEDNDEDEHSATCYIDVKGLTRQNDKWKLDNVIVPQIRSEVVKYVLNHEDANAFPNDFKVYDVKGVLMSPVSKEKESTARIKFQV